MNSRPASKPAIRSHYRAAMSTGGIGGRCIVTLGPTDSICYTDGGVWTRSRRPRSVEMSAAGPPSKKSRGSIQIQKEKDDGINENYALLGNAHKSEEERIANSSSSPSSSDLDIIAPATAPVLATESDDDSDGVVPILEGRSISKTDAFFRRACHNARLAWEVELNAKFDKAKAELMGKEEKYEMGAKTVFMELEWFKQKRD